MSSLGKTLLLVEKTGDPFSLRMLSTPKPSASLLTNVSPFSVLWHQVSVSSPGL